MFKSERFFREAWPTISRAVESSADAALGVQWILGKAGLKPGDVVVEVNGHKNLIVVDVVGPDEATAQAVERLLGSLRRTPLGGRMEQVAWAASGSEAAAHAPCSSPPGPGNRISSAVDAGSPLDVHGSVYVATSLTSTVVRVWGDGAIDTLATAADGLSQPSTLAFGTGRSEHQTLYVANFSLFVPDPTPGILTIPTGHPGSPVP